MLVDVNHRGGERTRQGHSTNNNHNIAFIAQSLNRLYLAKGQGELKFGRWVQYLLLD